MPLDFDMKDSGQRQEFETGARRDLQDGKGRPDLIPVLFIQRLARVMEQGAGKYGDRNWEKGMPLSRYYASAMRHMMQAFNGETDEDHLGQAAFNIAAFMWTQEMILDGVLPDALDDLPGKGNADKRTARIHDIALDMAPVFREIEEISAESRARMVEESGPVTREEVVQATADKIAGFRTGGGGWRGFHEALPAARIARVSDQELAIADAYVQEMGALPAQLDVDPPAVIEDEPTRTSVGVDEAVCRTPECGRASYPNGYCSIHSDQDDEPIRNALIGTPEIGDLPGPAKDGTNTGFASGPERRCSCAFDVSWEHNSNCPHAPENRL